MGLCFASKSRRLVSSERVSSRPGLMCLFLSITSANAQAAHPSAVVSTEVLLNSIAS